MPSPLPEPTAEQMARSQQLQSLIVEEIHRSGGWIPFDRYMEMALYTPGLGYYSTLQGLGAEGDFVTAPELSPLFSRVVARQIAPLLAQLEQPLVLELGAGSAVMAAEMLLELERNDQLPQQYWILELSGALRQRQQQTLEQRAPHLLERVEWLQQLPEHPFCGVVLANEVVDAIPAERFMVRGGAAVALGVSTNPDGGLIWSESPHDSVPPSITLDVAEGYCSEVRPAITPWIAALSEQLQQGALLLIDYGYERAEYYRPERNQGTLKCFYRHHQHEEPLSWPGLQDITAHVDFSAVAEAADAVGLSVAGYTTQAYFLLAGGLTRLAEAELLENLQVRVRTSQAIQQLTMPAQMGEVFKVMALTRAVSLPEHFTLRDQRHLL
jgi:SAM-dependent MidA family methyltransferase